MAVQSVDQRSGRVQGAGVPGGRVPGVRMPGVRVPGGRVPGVSPLDRRPPGVRRHSAEDAVPAREAVRRRPRSAARRRPPSGMVAAGSAQPALQPCVQVRPDQGYRMGRRARLAMTVTVAAAAVVAVASLLGTPGSATEVRPVTVEAGDTLWSIARENAPGDDPRAVVYAIQQLNGLGEEPLAVGVRLQVPVG